MPPFNYNQGRLLTNVQVTSIFARVKNLNPDGTVQSPTWVDSTTSTAQPVPAVCSINSFLRDILGSAYLGLLAKEYSPTGGPQIGYGSLSASSLIELPITRPAKTPAFTIQYTDVEAMLDSSIQNGVVPAPNVNSCYIIFFAGVMVVSPSGDIVGNTAGGFHSMFRSKAGINITYCVVDADDLGGMNTTFYTSHELVEAITNPDNNGVNLGGGWYDGDGKEIADVCFNSDSLSGLPLFHGASVASFWLRSQNRCGVPLDDNRVDAGAVVKIAPKKYVRHDCAWGIPCNTKVEFVASASVDGTVDALTNPSWAVPQDGAQIIGSVNQLTCTVLTPSYPSQFKLLFSGLDEFGCELQGQGNFSCVTSTQIAWTEELCALKHIILENWRFINPLWDPSRDFSVLPVRAAELARMQELVLQLKKVNMLLQRQPSFARNGKRRGNSSARITRRNKR